MAFEDSSARAGTATPGGAAGSESRYSGAGFRQEPDFRDAGAGGSPAGTPPPAPSPAGSSSDNEQTLTLSRKVPPTPNLDYVFDDPTEGEPGRDRLIVHGVWEVLLAIAAVAVGFLLYRKDSGAFSGDQLRTLLLSAAVLGALAVGSAFTLRAGAVNLALGPLAVAAALYYDKHASGGLLKALALVVGVALVVGAVQGLVVVGLHVPGWAAGLGTALALTVWIGSQGSISTTTNGYAPGPDAVYWFAGVGAASLLGGLLGLVPAIRRAVGRFRPIGDPAERRGVFAGLITLLATAASAAFAGVAGVLLGSGEGLSTATGSDGLALAGLVFTGLGVGAALLGGTSAFGRRGGVFGTALAVVLMTVTAAYIEATGRHWAPAAYAAAAIAAGLLVTRMVERFGRPDRDGDDDDYADDWTPTRPGSTTSWSAPREPSWQATASGPGTGTAGLWGSDDAWNR